MADDKEPIKQRARQEATDNQISQGDTAKTQNNVRDDQMSPVKSLTEVVNVGAQPRSTIDDMIEDLALRQALEMPVVRDPKGDTCVYIDAPPKQPEQGADAYERYTRRSREPFIVNSEALTRMNSPVIAKMFGPTEQYRTIRRRKLFNKLPIGVRFVIDLTPPSEGEEAVSLTASLCCSEGVRRWYQSHCIWRISPQQVGGEEEYTSIMSQQASYATAPIAKGLATPNVKGNAPLSKSIAMQKMPPEYTPLRHRSAIERVIVAAYGANPRLDSAPKVWTTFAVTRHLEIVDSPLTDHIVTWLRHYPNCFFLEVLPEVSLTIADGLKKPDLARDTFAIVVGEEALDNLCRAQKPHTRQKQTTFGRKKEEIPEAYQKRVEYASKAFADRIIAEFDEIVGENMHWVDDLYQCHLLSRHTQPQVQDIIKSLKTLLKEYVRGAIFKLLCINYAFVIGPDLPYEGGEDLFPRLERKSVWCVLSTRERILTRTFWHSLLAFTLFKGSSNLDVNDGWMFKAGEDEAVEQRMQACGCYHQVNRKDLRALIIEGADILERLAPRSESELPIREPSRHGDYADKEHVGPLQLSTKLSSVRSGQMPCAASRRFASSTDIEDLYRSDPSMLAQQQQTEEETSPLSKVLNDAEGQSLRTRSRNDTIMVGDHTFASSEEKNFFDLEAFFSETRETIKDFARRKLRYTDSYIRIEPQPLGITNTLVCLDDNEFKYLPLWAGGNDDGTNGVYNDGIPTFDKDFAAPIPHVHAGPSSHKRNAIYTPGARCTPTVNTSTAADDGSPHILHRGRVNAAESLPTTSTTIYDAFTVAMRSALTADEEEAHAHREVEARQRIEAADEEEAHARREVEARQRIEAAEDSTAAAAARRLEKGKFKEGEDEIEDAHAHAVEEEDYADLFDEEADFDEPTGEGEDQVELEEEEEEEGGVMI